MKNREQQHIIETQNLNIEVQGYLDDYQLRLVQTTLIHLFKNELGNYLDRLFSEMVPPDVHLVIDRLDIDLPPIDLRGAEAVKDFRPAVERYFKKVARETVQKTIIKSSGGRFEQQGTRVRVSKWTLFKDFLEKGHYPSWAGPKNLPISSVIEELMRKSPSKMAELLLDIGRRNPQLANRLIFQFSPRQLEQLLQLIYQQAGPNMLRQLQLILKRLGQRYRALRGQRSVQKAAYTVAFEYIFEKVRSGRKFVYKEQELVQKIVERIQKNYQHVSAQELGELDSGVRQEHSQNYGDLDLLEYFLQYGSIPYWAKTDSLASMRQLFDRLIHKRLSALQRLIIRQKDAPNFWQRLFLQFEEEQLLQLLEPLTEDRMRMVRSLLQQFHHWGQKEGISRHRLAPALMGQLFEQLLLNRSNFSEKTLIEGFLKEASQLSTKTKNKEELAQTLFKVLEQENNERFDLSRQELLKQLGQMLPKTQAAAHSELLKEEQLKRRSLAVELALQALEEELAQEDLDQEQMASLQKKKGRLQRQERQLQRELQAISGLAPSSIRALLDRKKWLKKRLIQLEKELKAEDKRIKAEDKAAEKERKAKQDEARQLRRIIRNMRRETKAIARELGKSYKKVDKEDRSALRELKLEYAAAVSDLYNERSELQLQLGQLEELFALGELSRAEKNQLQSQIRLLNRQLKQLDRELQQLDQMLARVNADLRKLEQDETAEEPSASSQIDFLVFFLQYGSIPWWAEEYRDYSIEAIFKQFAEKEADKLRKAVSRLGKNPIVWQRMVNQLSEEVLELVLIALFPRFAGFAISTAIMLEKIKAAQVFDKIKSISLKDFKWNKILEYLFLHPSHSNPQQFLKDLALELGRSYEISPRELLMYMTNLSHNNPETRLAYFADVIGDLGEDPSILAAEEALVQELLLRQRQADGLILSLEKKKEALEQYLLKGLFTEAAIRAKTDTLAGMEAIIKELLVHDRQFLRKLLLDAIGRAPARERLVTNFDNKIFWELVLLLNKSAMPLTQNYVQELGRALNDQKLFMVKDTVYRYLLELSQGGQFSVRSLVQQLLKAISRNTQRDPMLLLNDWKTKLRNLPAQRSGLVLQLLETEIALLRAQRRSTEDPSLLESLAQQLGSLELEQQHFSRQLLQVLNRERLEKEGLEIVPEDLEELYSRLEAIEKEIEELKSNIDEAQAMQKILRWRRIAELEAQRNLLRQEEPFAIRQLQQDMLNLRAEMERLDARINRLGDYAKQGLSAEEIRAEIAQLEQQRRALQERYKELQDQGKDATKEELALIRLRQELERLQRDLETELEALPEPELLERMLVDEWEQPHLPIEKIRQAPEVQEFLSYLMELPWKQAEADRIRQRYLQELQDHWEDLAQGFQANRELLELLRAKMRQLLLPSLQRMSQKRLDWRREIEALPDMDSAQKWEQRLSGREEEQIEWLERLEAEQWDDQMAKELASLRKKVRIYFRKMRLMFRRQLRKLAQAEAARLKEIQRAQEEEEKRLEAERIKRINELKRLEKAPELEAAEEETKVKPKKEQPKPADPPVDEPLYIRNAGLVILQPYYTRLFMALKMVSKGKFVNEEAQIRATHMLQYIATRQTETPENELVLNKIMCGLPLSTPVPMDVGLTEQELGTCDSLLQGAINNWSRMRTMTPDALRGTFLIRDGNIKEEADRWKLKVEKGSFDMLLRTLPWGFTFVRYGWLPKFIAVEWDIPGT